MINQKLFSHCPKMYKTHQKQTKLNNSQYRYLEINFTNLTHFIRKPKILQQLYSFLYTIQVVRLFMLCQNCDAPTNSHPFTFIYNFVLKQINLVRNRSLATFYVDGSVWVEKWVQQCRSMQHDWNLVKRFNVERNSWSWSLLPFVAFPFAWHF